MKNYLQIYCNTHVPLQKITVKSVIIPDDAIGFSKPDVDTYSDFAIFELQNPIGYGKFMRPICLPSAKQFKKDAISISYGFGNTDYIENRKKTFEVEPINTVLKWFTVYDAHQSEDLCEKATGLRSCGNRFRAYLPVFLQGACQGDSGGGFEKFINNRHILFGILSRAVNASCQTNYKKWLTRAPIYFSMLEPYIDYICYHTGIYPDDYSDDDDYNIEDTIDQYQQYDRHNQFETSDMVQPLKGELHMINEHDLVHKTVSDNIKPSKQNSYSNNVFIVSINVSILIYIFMTNCVF